MPGRRIYCRNCYREGHNKRSCPSLTQRYRDRFDSHTYAASEYEGGTGASYNNQQAEHYRALVIGRTGIDPKTDKKVTKKAAKAARMKDRKCTYCAGKGHTRRTCDILKEDMQVMKEATKINREEVAARLRSLCINKGTLVMLSISTYIGNEWTRLKLPYMVTGFRWDRCMWGCSAEQAGIVELKCLSSRLTDDDRYRRVSLRNLEDGIALSEVTVSSYGVKPPADWLDGKTTDPIKVAFPTATKRNYDFETRAYREESSPYYLARKTLGFSMEQP